MIDKLKKIFISLFMVISITTSTLTSVNAWDSSIPHQFTRVKEIDYPEWWSRKIGIRQWSTFMCEYNGNYAYCLEASKNTPATGNYTAQVIESNSAVRKLLYYGFGGPGYNTEIESMYKQQLNACVPDDFGDAHGNYVDGAYLFTHIWLSYAYSQDLMGLSLEAFNAKWPNPDGNGGYGDNILWGYREIISKPDPSNGAAFSTGSTAKFNATFDRENMIQVSNSVKFNASASETVQIPLQDNVTLHIDGTSSTQTGGTATVYGGQTFYLTAPLENSPTDYQSGNLNSSAKGKFCALSISSGVSGTQTEGSWAQEPVKDLKYSADWLDFGWIDLVKKSDNENMTNNNSCYSLEGAKYGVYSDGVQVDTLVTDEDGYAKSSILPVGNYTVKEITASTGYDLDENTYNVTIIKDQTVRADSLETPGNDPIAITIVKNDAQTLGMPQGDATLEGAEFTIKYYDGYYTEDDLPKEATRTWVLQTVKRPNGLYVANFTTTGCVIKDRSDDLFYQDGMPTLPLGTISIEETKAPKGYLLKGNTLNVTDNTTGETTTVEDSKYVAQVTKEYQGAKLQFGNDANEMVVTEKVKKQKIQIFKSGYRNGQSEVVKGLANAEFTFKLKSEVDEKGWDAATTYDVITTGEDGWAITKDLPFGEYQVRETVTPKDFYTNPDFTVSITKDTSEYENDEDKVKKVILNNRPVETQLKLVKKDEETGKNITLNSASFKIVADEDILDGGNVVYKKGDYITQKIGGKKYDTFTTNSDNVVVVKTEYTSDDDDKGEVFLPLQFFAGKYHLEEVKVPLGFIGEGKTQPFELSGMLDYTKDEDGDPIYTVTVKDEQPKAQIKLNKSLADLDTDVDLVDRSDLSKIHFVLKADEDIYSPVDGSLMFAKDDIITTDASGAVVNTGTEIGNGVYALSIDGHLDISNLPMGVGEAQYYLQEVKTLDGCVLDESKYIAEFEQSDYTTKIYIKDLDIYNKTTHYEFNKTDVTGDQEVEGATLTIKDEDGNVVDEWVSNKTVHSIEGLVVGKTYTLSETVVADGYVKASDITFTVKNTSELETITMKDKVVTVSKQDAGGNEVEGALLQVIDEDGNIVDEWISGDEEHKVNGLEEGKTYTLHEDLSPIGYNVANDIEFEVTTEKVNQTIEMIDTIAEVSKTDENKSLLKGAELEVVSTQTKNIVDKWTTGQHLFDVTDEMKAELEAGNTVSDMMISEDDSTTLYKITPHKDDFTLMLQSNGETSYYNIDIEGNETEHMIQGLVAGQAYILRETKAPNGYATAKEQTFIADEDKDVHLSMVDEDTKVEVSKQDITTNKELEGASLQITDKDGNVVDEWVSGKVPHMIKNLTVGETYTLTETIAPKNYKVAQSINFTIKDTGVVQKVVMYDELLPVKVKTGDDTDLVLYASAGIGSFALLSILSILKRKKR